MDIFKKAASFCYKMSDIKANIAKIKAVSTLKPRQYNVNNTNITNVNISYNELVNLAKADTQRQQAYFNMLNTDPALCAAIRGSVANDIINTAKKLRTLRNDPDVQIIIMDMVSEFPEYGEEIINIVYGEIPIIYEDQLDD